MGQECLWDLSLKESPCSGGRPPPVRQRRPGPRCAVYSTAPPAAAWAPWALEQRGKEELSAGKVGIWESGWFSLRVRDAAFGVHSPFHL